MSPALDSILLSPENDSIKEQLYTNLFSTYNDQNKNTELGTDAHELAKWYYRQSNKEKPIKYTQLAIEARKKAIPYKSSDLKISYYNLGFFYKKNKEYSKSILAFKKMLSIKEPSPYNARSYTNIADSYDILGDPFLAVENHLNAFLFFDPKKDKLRILDNHINIAVAYKAIRQPDSAKEAIKHLLIADSLANSFETPKPEILHAIYKNIGGEYYEGFFDQDIEKAIFYFEKALKIAREIYRRDYIGRLYYNLGIVHVEKDVSIAKQYFSKSLEYPENNNYLKPSIYLGFGLAAYKEKDYTKAQDYYLRSLSFFFKENHIKNDWLPNKQQLVSIKNKDLLLELFKRKLQTSLNQGIQQNDNNFYKYAIEVSKASDELIDVMLEEDISYKSKLFWRDLASEIYVLALEACYQTQRLEDAFYFMEKNKALLLMQDVTKNKIELPEHILERELELKNSIITLQTKSLEATKEEKDTISISLINKKHQFHQFKDSLSTIYPDYFSSTTIPKTLQLSEVELNDDEIILQYTMAEKVAEAIPDAYVMIISKTKKELFKLENVDSILKNIILLREKLDVPFRKEEDIISYKKIANKLYNLLISKEIQLKLKNKKVTIIADHMISFIPFDALITNTESGDYLIENCEINYAYSLSFQKENATVTRKAKQDFMGLAPVNFSNDLTTLKKSEDEINNVTRYYNGDLYTKTKATKENFKKQVNNYRIFHLATHANASDSIAPWIAFHNDKLNHLELNTLRSQAELVVLSACNTSLGEVRRGEGVMSLARGFFKSGAHTVIPSLWNTNDKATATITSNFYKNLSEGKTKSEALRAAKLNYLNNNSDAEASPHYWASLVLIGDTGVLLPRSDYTIFIYIGIAILFIIVFYILFLKKYKST